MRHKSRSIDVLPGPGHASALLAEIATAPCPFAPASARPPLALYGAGSLGLLARDYLKAIGHDFVMVIDRNARALAAEPVWSGVKLLHPEDVEDATKRDVRLAISVVTAPYVQLEHALMEDGFQRVIPFYDIAESFRHMHPLSNGWFGPPLDECDRDNTAGVLAHWYDDVSRAHHLQFLAWRRLREEWAFHLAPVITHNRFFIPEVCSVLRDDEVFLDAGAHYGGVTEVFVERMKGAFRQIVAIEPDPFNHERLESGLQNLLPDDARITVHDCALAEDSHEALFHSGLGYASQLSSTGGTHVVTCRIDDLDVRPTFMKLHLEGAELAALKGARQTLLDCRPIVAATVYHNDDGIWKTASWLIETLAHYRFFFRCHSWCGTGAVVYAIPNERYKS